MGLKFSNFGKAVIAAAPSGVSGLSFSVEAGKGLLFPALGSGDYFYGIFKDASGNREIVKVESRGTDNMTIAVGGRGLDGTVARTWAAGDYFVAGITNVALNESLSNANLISLGALTSAADKLAYFTAPGVAALTALTPFARNLLDDADAPATRETLDAVSLSGNESITGNKTFSGLSTFSNNLVMQGRPILFAQATVAAHATAANIWVANSIWLSGSAITISDFADAPQAGAEAEVYCDAAHTFVYSSNLILQGGTNFMVAQGDRLRIRAISTTVFVVERVPMLPFTSGTEYRAGTSASKAVTPAALAEGSLSAVNGRFWTPGGFLEQWGTLAVNGDIPGFTNVTVIFPVTFNVVYNIVAHPYAFDGNRDLKLNETGLNTSQATFTVVEGSSSVQITWGLRWRAIGR